MELVLVHFNIFVTGYWYRMEKNRMEKNRMKKNRMRRNTMEKKEARRRVS